MKCKFCEQLEEKAKKLVNSVPLRKDIPFQDYIRAQFASMHYTELFRWHDIRKNPKDLPTCDCETITLHENGNKNIQRWQNGNWTNAIIIPIVAWCEIPEFNEK